MSTELVRIPKKNERDIFTVKGEEGYYGVIDNDSVLYICPTAFDSPLKAANHARSLKKQHSIASEPKELKKVETSKIRSTVPKKKQLFTEAEVADRTHLRFKEVWVVINPEGNFVVKAIKDSTLVEYSKDKELAAVFKTYEDAAFTLNTLDMVVRKGHQLRRYFEKLS